MAQEATAPPQAMRGLTAGRIVHYVMPDGQHRPAIVVRTWERHSPDMVNLQVFTDQTNDRQEAGTLWATSIHHNDTDKPAGTWHWIEPA